MGGVTVLFLFWTVSGYFYILIIQSYAKEYTIVIVFNSNLHITHQLYNHTDKYQCIISINA